MPILVITGDALKDIWFLFSRTQLSILRYINTKLSKSSKLTTRQYMVLSAIKEIRDRATQANVANWLDRNPNTILSIVDHMEAQKLVKRVKVKNDRRVLKLELTEKGEEEYAKAGNEIGEFPEKIFAVLTPEELSTLANILRKLREETLKLSNVQDEVIDLSKTSTSKNITPKPHK
jgi:DNA-binding MarR family transcriptional regulator